MSSLHRSRSPEDFPAIKRAKHTHAVQIEAPFSGGRTALEVKFAIDKVTNMPALGHWKTGIREWYHERGHENGYPPEDLGRYGVAIHNPDANEELILGLGSIRREICTQASGILLSAFNITITLPGCELKFEIKPCIRTPRESSELLQRLYDHAATSAIGNMVKPGPCFRRAREIPAAQFFVEQRLLDEIAGIWANKFRPRQVRIEPYEIHLYGPGDHFKSPPDTPATGLVGTFFLGLGDTSCFGFQVGDRKYTSHPGEWVAFCPDVPHQGEALRQGTYRVMIAFQIYWDSEIAEDIEENLLPPDIVSRVMNITNKMRGNFGILLQKKYCMATHQLSGFDDILYTCFRERRDVEVHLLPVVIQWHCLWSENQDEHGEDWATADVYPFTDAIVDLLNAGGRDFTEIPGYAWMKELNSNAPFYSMESGNSNILWCNDEHETVHVDGDAWRRDSLYLSFALTVIKREVVEGKAG